MKAKPDFAARFHLATCVLVTICGVHLSSAADHPINFYVSPEGSDLFTGTLSRNNAGRTDGPFATIQHARDVVRANIQSAGDRRVPINVYMRGGTYWLVDPLIFTPADSGSQQAPVTYQAMGNEKPVVSAGKPVRGWAKATLNGHDVWAAKLPQFAGSQASFAEMWVGGKRRVMARLPNKGYFRAGAVPDLA